MCGGWWSIEMSVAVSPTGVGVESGPTLGQTGGGLPHLDLAVRHHRDLLRAPLARLLLLEEFLAVSVLESRAENSLGGEVGARLSGIRAVDLGDAVDAVHLAPSVGGEAVALVRAPVGLALRRLLGFQL